MTDEPGRVLSADPWSIQLSYRHRQPWWFDANSEPERWHVSADVGDGSGTEVAFHVGDIDIVLVDVSATADPFSLLDGEDTDLGVIAEAIFDPATGHLAASWTSWSSRWGVVFSSSTPSGLPRSGVASGSVSCRPGQRSRSCPVVPGSPPATPASPGEPGDGGREEGEDSVERGVAMATLSEVWGQLGFDHFRGGVHVLDLNLVTLDESLERLRKQVG